MIVLLNTSVPSEGNSGDPKLNIVAHGLLPLVVDGRAPNDSCCCAEVSGRQFFHNEPMFRERVAMAPMTRMCHEKSGKEKQAA